MNNYLVLALLCTLSITATAEDTQPWPIRYVLFVDTVKGFRQSAIQAKSRNADELSTSSMYLSADELLTQTSIFDTSHADHIATILIQFDRAGDVNNEYPPLAKLKGTLMSSELLVLADHMGRQFKQYYLADWESEPEPRHYLPAPCTQRDHTRYVRPWDYGSENGGVGCREWTAQLYRKQRPYIDITTYADGRNFIGKLMGWARFEDAPKPVIGLQAKTWLCLHECPAGEKPGIIPDIYAWARKHGYPIPVAPAKQPEYPDTETED